MSSTATDSSSPNPALDVATMRLYLDAQRQLCVTDVSGHSFVNVAPVRLFPLSHPNQWIALIDAQGRELACLPDMLQLSAECQSILADELSIREFVPILKRVTWVSGNSEPCEWRVETDRGPTRFILKDENDVRRLGDKSVLIVDSFGIRYLVPDRNQLDHYSKRIIEWYV